MSQYSFIMGSGHLIRRLELGSGQFRFDMRRLFSLPKVLLAEVILLEERRYFCLLEVRSFLLMIVSFVDVNIDVDVDVGVDVSVDDGVDVEDINCPSLPLSIGHTLKGSVETGEDEGDSFNLIDEGVSFCVIFGVDISVDVGVGVKVIDCPPLPLSIGHTLKGSL